ncbi:phosphate ABC transporter substrate-binding protein PstS [Nonomuraea sediminis]|uniref:phosphate ABC transporter substrate-binding protein PstS n=1 Tax=Nonomuraea sediminis TaxID=2835864 RepID=UPI001BDBE983|nr:phosphate ABC transporter substrate-binding protein PstS [Nonomuraea sediminis]
MRGATAAGAATLLVAALLAACGDEQQVSSMPGQAATIIGSGSTAQLGAIDAWRAGYARTVPGARIIYRANGSDNGIRDFIRGDTAFAGSDVAMNREQKAQADKRCAGRALHLPMVVGPIAVIYNLPAITALRLSPTTLTGIFSGKITTWADPAIARENPGVNLPHTGIRVFHRSNGSGTSKNLTRTLRAMGGWPYKPSTHWSAPGGEDVQGSAEMTDSVSRTEGAIGYVEYGYASGAGLRTAKIRNAAGEYVALSPESASRSLSGAEVAGTGGDLTVKVDPTVKRWGAYPIVLLTYEIVCDKGSPALLRGFLRYIASDAGQSNLSLLGYAPLPPELLAKVRASLATMT